MSRSQLLTEYVVQCRDLGKENVFALKLRMSVNPSCVLINGNNYNTVRLIESILEAADIKQISSRDFHLSRHT